jgi:Translocon-associated protein beta (TRAPB).
MKFLSFLVLVALSSYALGNDEEETGARLLISKHILNKYLVEDMDIVVKVSTTVISLIPVRKIKIGCCNDFYNCYLLYSTRYIMLVAVLLLVFS